VVLEMQEGKEENYTQLKTIAHQNKTYFLVFLGNGNAHIVSLEDILTLSRLNHETYSKDLIFLYAQFSYFKDFDSFASTMNFAMLEIVKNSHS
jgi:hypothetical protein